MEAKMVALVTCPVGEADSIASQLVEDRLAACVNIVAEVTSVYRWEGKVHKEEESLLVIKTTKDQLEGIDAKLREIHPYEVYELVAMEIEAGSPAYLEWIASETK